MSAPFDWRADEIDRRKRRLKMAGAFLLSWVVGVVLGYAPLMVAAAVLVGVLAAAALNDR